MQRLLEQGNPQRHSMLPTCYAHYVQVTPRTCPESRYHCRLSGVELILKCGVVNGKSEIVELFVLGFTVN